MSVTDSPSPRARRRWPALLGVLAAAAILAVGVRSYLVKTAHRAVRLSPIAPGALAALGAPGRAEGYNLLFITIDTVRVDRFGCYGYTRAETPNIDRLTEHGVQFLQAIAPAPLTLPSHSTMMTGLDVPSHGARDNGSFLLAEDKDTLAEILAEQGYATAAFVGAYVLDARYGLDQGFGTYDQNVNPGGGDAPSGQFNERSADAVTDAAIAWLDGRDEATRERPFFAWVHYFDAHAPYAPPPAFAKRFAHPYDREIAFVDSEIGRLLAHVERAEEAGEPGPPTLVVLASDHGEGLGEHGEETHSRLIYDSTMHVPLILSCPALFDRRVTVGDRVVSLADIFPTALDLLGVAREAPIDGVNLLTPPADAQRTIYIETMAPLVNNGWASLHGLRRLDEKYILAPRRELYDVAVDPGELENLYDDEPARAALLAAALDARMEAWDLPERVLARAARLDPEQLRRLAALGYVQADDLGSNVGRLDPKDMVPLWQDMMRAQTLSNDGDHERAAARIEKVLEESPNDAQAWSIASIIHKRRERWDDAERAMKRSVELHATAEGWVRVAQFMLRRGAAEEADAALAEAAAIDPRNGYLYITRGDRLAMAGRFAEARLEFERALEVDPVRLGAIAREKIMAAKVDGSGQ